jgi:hypothetical protein
MGQSAIGPCAVIMSDSESASDSERYVYASGLCFTWRGGFGFICFKSMSLKSNICREVICFVLLKVYLLKRNIVYKFYQRRFS